MKQYLQILCCVCLFSCQKNKENQITLVTEPVKTDTTTLIIEKEIIESQSPIDTTDYEHTIFYVVIVDTSFNYQSLHKKMLDLSKKSNTPIDTMGRYYNASEDLIVLSDDDDDLYAGDYFPRRFPSENLSLEYLTWYKNNAEEKTIALVAGIYESEIKADSAVSKLKKTNPQTFEIKTKMFVGCMH
ncbi:hypothetical protein FIA58_005785 [Flavobacterium jejuense]|uniref:SPOR domain-containing protein n=1 Tax=Flavobacterium jejuense TaxID=1544455 RepID=A0ABX0ITP5_9FLAO|nr:hypothetical protein [Flavobacterium jejuense]NHN25185.1 hypothetical protein [Flavobacterium jejuense]